MPRRGIWLLPSQGLTLGVACGPVYGACRVMNMSIDEAALTRFSVASIRWRIAESVIKRAVPQHEAVGSPVGWQACNAFVDIPVHHRIRGVPGSLKSLINLGVEVDAGCSALSGGLLRSVLAFASAS